MIILNGKGVFGGVAVGKIAFLSRGDIQVVREKIADVQAEISRYNSAKETSIRQLSELFTKAVGEVGEANANIFEIHKMMLEDEDYNESILHIIESRQVNAEYAVAATGDNFASLFLEMEDEYMNARAADVKDISNRIIANLSQKQADFAHDGGKCIICADDLTPSETVSLNKDMVLAFVTKYGSSNSHTAILARTMNIPAIIGVGEELSDKFDGKTAAVDGFTGEIFIEPDEEILRSIKAKSDEQQRRKALLRKLRGKKNITLDGTEINIFANIGNPRDVGDVLLNDAGGIGLFRSEFLYLESTSLPDEQTQFSAYKRVLESMACKKVVIRTMDIGADKKIGYLGAAGEENPALGYRAVRICLCEPEIFKTQLRALMRASVYGNLSVMFPMITSTEEVTEIKNILGQVKYELTSEGLAYSENVEIGVMIETPAAAVISDILAPEVDFFSIGTNDLIQYTLAADRQNPRLERFCNPHHEAIFRLIEYTVKSAHSHGKWVGICGELAADLTLTERWLRMGIDELSVSPPFILPLREKVRQIKLPPSE